MLKRMRLRLLVLAALLAFYAIVKLSPMAGPADVTVGSKNFTESLVLGEIYALGLEEAGFRVERKFNLGGTLIAHEALKRGEIDFYPEYTGTGLINVLHLPATSDHKRMHKLLDSEYRKRWDLRWLPPSEANDGQGLVITRATARKYDLYTLSRLSELAPQLTLASVPEFEEREDGLKGLRKFYGGFDFKQVQLYDHGLKYRVLQAGQADVTVGFTTDGVLTDPGLVLLRDDRTFWPPYRVAPVVRNQAITGRPAMAGVLNGISARLDTRTLQTLNAEVDLKHRDYRDVAAEFMETRLARHGDDPSHD